MREIIVEMPYLSANERNLTRLWVRYMRIKHWFEKIWGSNRAVLEPDKYLTLIVIKGLLILLLLL